MEAWPESLPKRAFSNFEAQLRCGLNSSDEEINPARKRTYPERETDFKVFVNGAQLATFRTFHDATLNGGGAPFTAPWLVAMGYGFHFLRFREAPTWTAKGDGKWIINMPVEIIAGVETDGEGNTLIYPPLEVE